MPETNLTFLDRLAMSFFGGVTGALYGVFLWVLAFYFTSTSHPSLIAWSTVVFASLGVFFGNFIAEAFLALLHFLCGLFSAFAEYWPSSKYETTENHLHSFYLLGIGTGLVLLFWWYW
jgi:hypothetical protein